MLSKMKTMESPTGEREKSEDEPTITCESQEDPVLPMSSGPSKNVPEVRKIAARPWIRSRLNSSQSPFAARVLEIPSYSFTDYQNHLQRENWTMEETDHLFDLAHRFALKFSVMHDRWNRETFTARSIEDLKERYYSCVSILSKHKADSGSSEQMKDNVYDKEHKIAEEKLPVLLQSRTPEQLAEKNWQNKEHEKINQKRKEEEMARKILKTLSSRMGRVEKQTQSDEEFENRMNVPSSSRKLPIIPTKKSVRKLVEEGSDTESSDEPEDTEKDRRKQGGKVAPRNFKSTKSIQNVDMIDLESESYMESELPKEMTHGKQSFEKIENPPDEEVRIVKEDEETCKSEKKKTKKKRKPTQLQEEKTEISAEKSIQMKRKSERIKNLSPRGTSGDGEPKEIPPPEKENVESNSYSALRNFMADISHGPTRHHAKKRMKTFDTLLASFNKNRPLPYKDAFPPMCLMGGEIFDAMQQKEELTSLEKEIKTLETEFKKLYPSMTFPWSFVFDDPERESKEEGTPESGSIPQDEGPSGESKVALLKKLEKEETEKMRNSSPQNDDVKSEPSKKPLEGSVKKVCDEPPTPSSSKSFATAEIEKKGSGVNATPGSTANKEEVSKSQNSEGTIQVTKKKRRKPGKGIRFFQSRPKKMLQKMKKKQQKMN